jgi:DNA-binding response OmpR family regulator
MTGSVLIVDDEPNIVHSLRFLMTDAGLDVRIAKDGDAALAAIAQRVPDVVLLDVMLPGSDGYEVCRMIRMNPAWREVRIIMLTARGRDSERAKGLEIGADAYITKPFSTRELVEQVKRFLGRSAS